MGVLVRAQDAASPVLTTTSEELVDDISTAYQRSQVLLTAHRLKLFEALQAGPRTSGDLARRLDADARGMRILCRALVAIGLVQAREEHFALAAPARDCLLPDSPRSKYAMLSHTGRMFEQWSHLYETVKTGKPNRGRETTAPPDASEREFARAMADVGRVTAGKTVDLLDLSCVRTVLDVGAGPGVYGIEFARRHEDLTVVLLDREETLDVARHYVERAGVADRVRFRRGDMFKDDLGGPYDLVFISNVLHLFPGDACRALVSRCADVMTGAGRLAVKDFLMNDDQTSPPGGAMFAVTMLLNTEGGECHTVAELEEWFDSAGLRVESVLEITPKSRLAVGGRV